MMAKQRIFLTGATGTMGFLGVQELLKDSDKIELVVLVRDTDKNKELLEPFTTKGCLEIVLGDLVDYQSVERCVRDADIVLHVGAFVSPAADYYPEVAMQVNYGSSVNIIKAIKALRQEQKTRFVYIGTVAETGDRMPPIHWGRVGDPLKPSVYDYYAVSKIAAERHVVESELPYWVSLRQTGIMGPAMASIEDAIMFHNCLDNVLEYVSDKDSAILLRNLCAKERNKELGSNFWGHIFNIGGGESCRVSTYDMYTIMFGAIGLKDLSYAADTKWYATRNFHGQYYLDSDKLNDILDFRHDSMQYFYDAYLKNLGGTATAARILTKLPGGQKFMGNILKKRFLKLAQTEHGTVNFTENNREEHIAAYWGSKEAWEAIPDFKDFKHFTDWDTVVPINHGYDENKPEETLNLEDINGAAHFRGGKCLSNEMITGDWMSKLHFECAFGHKFEASPRLVLEGGHWCPECERESWNYYERAKKDPFFAQVWTPLHDKKEKEYTYPKIVSELDVTDNTNA
ncbi:NAD-dependent epimerase/dehydratase family protein [Scatolibacter rhodanostii]|uniref:NAD-dependent epimerase/dehydratase family protein n=1 Tax=Scatolibacter rhodanostii TaxID=2014781 RepID=UPI001FA91F82|nr:NAD(P)-dependent oxidoreductase [Scatolibacter rhodanostii]